MYRPNDAQDRRREKLLGRKKMKLVTIMRRSGLVDMVKEVVHMSSERGERTPLSGIRSGHPNCRGGRYYRNDRKGRK